MTREEAIKSALKFLVRKQQEQGSWGYADNDDTHEVSWDEIIEWIDQQPCETIKEIPKYYKYDTETKDFLVYRHMYTGHEIHIEKPVPRYKLEQQPCEDCISRSEAIRVASGYCHWSTIPDELAKLPSVFPRRKSGKWVTKEGIYGVVYCSECNYELHMNDSKYCPNCGAEMEGKNE